MVTKYHSTTTAFCLAYHHRWPESCYNFLNEVEIIHNGLKNSMDSTGSVSAISYFLSISVEKEIGAEKDRETWQ